MNESVRSRRPVNALLIATAGVTSIFFPSSIGGEIDPILTVWQCAIVSLIFFVTLRHRRWIFPSLPIAILVLMLFLIFTVTSPLPEFTPGSLMPYLLLLTVLMIDMRTVGRSRAPLFALLLINLCLLALGFGTLFHSQFGLEISERFYKAYDDELFASMISASKPVTVFASHSIAALAYFALFLLNLRLSRFEAIGRRTRHFLLLSSCGYVLLLPALTSNTSFALFLPALAMLAWHVFRFLRPAVRMVVICLILVAGIAIVRMVIEPATLEALSDLVEFVWSYEGGGFLGRYAIGGRLQPTYDFLASHYFLPIGLSYSPALALGDNFIAEYIIKISVIGYGALLLMLWTWLRRGVRDRRSRIGFMLFLLAADIGYPLLPYPRAAGFMPLFAMLWMYTGAPSRPATVLYGQPAARA